MLMQMPVTVQGWLVQKWNEWIGSKSQGFYAEVVFGHVSGKNDYLARVQVERPYGWRSRPQRFGVAVQCLHNARVQDPQHLLRVQVHVDGVLHIARLTLFLDRQAGERRQYCLVTRVTSKQTSRGHSGWHAGSQPEIAKSEHTIGIDMNAEDVFKPRLDNKNDYDLFYTRVKRVKWIVCANLFRRFPLSFAFNIL